IPMHAPDVPPGVDVVNLRVTRTAGGERTLDYDENIALTAFPFSLVRHGEGPTDFEVRILHPQTGEIYAQSHYTVNFLQPAEGPAELEVRFVVPETAVELPMELPDLPPSVDVVNVRVIRVDLYGDNTIDYDENIPAASFPFMLTREGLGAARFIVSILHPVTGEMYAEAVYTVDTAD
ncbi:MAG: hypothetical protein FWE20_12525, partial [Defluviitaleaceae bacterium]|nr:hypothetical protein [Defluviitaleaceae bacterium]